MFNGNSNAKQSITHSPLIMKGWVIYINSQSTLPVIIWKKYSRR